ncbi:50S ribosomal protein L11 [Candidatus Woesearchaeota archaeon]|nr:50S ribosomal protein L11 [Candidatus Woesearchaeota archaeon]
MSKEKIDLMIEGGKAVPNASLSQALGPLRVDIPTVIKKINEKTLDFDGMKLPVKVIIDTKTKDIELEIGTPPVSELIKKEINAQKGSGMPNKDKIGNLAIEHVIKIAKMKFDSMHVNSMKSAVKNVIGSCHSIGVLVEGKTAIEVNKDIDQGIYDDLIKNIKTDVSEEKKSILEKQLKEVQEKIQKELERMAKEAAAKEEVKEEKVIAQETELGKETKEAVAPKEKGKESKETVAKAPEKKEEKKK